MFYKLYQNLRKGAMFGKWYAHAANIGTVNIDKLAERISAKCTVTKPDIVAVITALLTEISDSLQAGMKVVLDGFGMFKLGLASKPADSAKAWSVNTHVKGLRVLFSPLKRFDHSSHKFLNSFTQGCAIQSLADYKDPSKKENAKGNDSDNGGDGPEA